MTNYAVLTFIFNPMYCLVLVGYGNVQNVKNNWILWVIFLKTQLFYVEYLETYLDFFLLAGGFLG